MVASAVLGVAILCVPYVRWLLLSRFPQIDFPEECGWAMARPDLFAVRFQDQSNVIFEFLPWQKRRG